MGKPKAPKQAAAPDPVPPPDPERERQATKRTAQRMIDENKSKGSQGTRLAAATQSRNSFRSAGGDRRGNASLT